MSATVTPTITASGSAPFTQRAGRPGLAAVRRRALALRRSARPPVSSSGLTAPARARRSARSMGPKLRSMAAPMNTSSSVKIE